MPRGIAVCIGLLAALIAAAVCLDVSPQTAGPQPPRLGGPPLSLPQPVRPRFSPDIRVCLTDEPVERIEIAVDGGYRVQPVGVAQDLARGARLPETIVTATADGLQIGRQTLAVSRVEIVPDRSPAVWAAGHQYRGRLRLFRQPGGRLLAVNVLPLEEYVASVIDSEMPAAFPDEARRAQAIVARTYALWQRERRHPLFDVFASTRSQRYLGFQYRSGDGRRLAGESAASREIAADTAGMVSTRGGRLFCTYYSAVCGGRTVAGRAVFADATELASVPCAFCREAPLYRWTRTVPRSQFEAKLLELLAGEGLAFDSLRSAAARDRPDGTVELLVSDGRREHRIAAATLRSRLVGASLPSPRFALEPGPAEVTFHGRGHGHGVGLCQWGARGLASAGRTAADILRYYYPGSRVVALDGGG
ncbi:MAG TPA: SpoIID/LytB domain-containing protein [Planctomycetaceae bacterium]|nr:SpoIID/LytB domain-containing protein [Planctomycetaceae bacterium]